MQDIIVGVIVAAAVVFFIRHLAKGKCGCCKGECNVSGGQGCRGKEE